MGDEILRVFADDFKEKVKRLNKSWEGVYNYKSGVQLQAKGTRFREYTKDN